MINADYYEVHFTSKPDNVLLVEAVNHDNSGFLQVIAHHQKTGIKAWEERMTTTGFQLWLRVEHLTYRRTSKPVIFDINDWLSD